MVLIMDPILVSEIPTLASLYTQNKISPSDETLPTPVPGATAAHNERLSILRADITTLAVDAIVNAAKPSLMGGRGVDGAIHRAAGRELRAACARLPQDPSASAADGSSVRCAAGDAKLTEGYRLPAKYVIHTVGPVYHRTGPERARALLASCYDACLSLAAEHGIRTVAFSGISTGVYGYPSVDAAEVACERVKKFLDDGELSSGIERVIFVTFEEKDVHAYNANLP